jgi:hypothetical protein
VAAFIFYGFALVSEIETLNFVLFLVCRNERLEQEEKGNTYYSARASHDFFE